MSFKLKKKIVYVFLGFCIPFHNGIIFINKIVKKNTYFYFLFYMNTIQTYADFFQEIYNISFKFANMASYHLKTTKIFFEKLSITIICIIDFAFIT